MTFYRSRRCEPECFGNPCYSSVGWAPPTNTRMLQSWWAVPIDGRPCFAKRSIDGGKKVKIAAIDPDFMWSVKPLSLMEYAGRYLYHPIALKAQCAPRVLPVTCLAIMS